jgi:CNT family concentrative nucleoside transporter
MAMLIAFIALVYLLNAALGQVGTLIAWTLDGTGLVDATLLDKLRRMSFEGIVGWLFQPLAAVMGVPWSEADEVGALLGKRTILNEFVAYTDLAELVKQGRLSDRSVTIATYALCGFANFSSIAIQIGGIGSLAPERRPDLARFGLRAMVGGTLASFMTANIAGALL